MTKLMLQILKKKTERLEGGEFRRQYMRSLGNHTEALVISSIISKEILKESMQMKKRRINELWRSYLKNGAGRNSRQFKLLQSLKLSNSGIIMHCFKLLEDEQSSEEMQTGDIFLGDEYALGVFAYEFPEVK